MNKAREIYAARARRVAKAMVWLKTGLQLHAARAIDPEYARMLWNMIDDLGVVEWQLKKLVTRVQPVTMDDLDDDLSGGGQGDE